MFDLQVRRIAIWPTDLSVEHGETLVYADCLLYASPLLKDTNSSFTAALVAL